MTNPKQLRFPSVYSGTNTYPPILKTPSFEVYQKGSDSKLVQGCVKAFLMKRFLTLADLKRGYIEKEDSSLWVLIVEPAILTELNRYPEDREVECLLSYQVHRNGSFVVARLYKDKDGSNHE